MKKIMVVDGEEELRPSPKNRHSAIERKGKEWLDP
jgi:hypothetical protein